MANTNTLAPAHDLLVPPHTSQPESKGESESEDAETNPYQILLRSGEIYVGAIGDAAGNLQHTILLPGDRYRDTWDAQMEWAKSIGGDLPTRIEQALLYANLKEEFEECAYWSNETCHSEFKWAWFQGLDYGNQNVYDRSYELRARAVRRVVQRNPLLVFA